MPPSLMPPSSTQPQSRVTIGDGARTNDTINIFLGGTQKPWMMSQQPPNHDTGASFPSSAVPKRKRGWSRKDPKGPQNAFVPDQESRMAEQLVVLPAYVDDERNNAVLPSPAPTDEPSPNVSTRNDSPNYTTSGYGDGPAPMQQPTPYQHDANHDTNHSAYHDVNHDAMIPTSNNNPNSNDAVELGFQAAAGGPSRPHSVGATVQASLYEANITTAGQPVAINHMSRSALATRQEDDTGLSAGSTAHTTAMAAEAHEPPQKRARLGPLPQGPEARAQETTPRMKDWQNAVYSRTVQSASSPAGLDPLNETPRYRILQDACCKNDIWYIAIHQLFCLWTLDRPSIHGFLGPWRVTPAIIDGAFSQLKHLLRDNGRMARTHVEWFSAFPGQVDQVLQELPYYGHALRDASLFLGCLAHNWEPFWQTLQRRQYPLIAYEMDQSFKCPSPLIRQMLYTMSRRGLGVNDGLLANELNAIFAQDSINENRFATLKIPNTSPEVQKHRQDLITRYRVLISRSVRHPHRGEFRNSFPPAGGSLTSPASDPASSPRTGHEMPPAQQSPNLSHPQTFMPITSTPRTSTPSSPAVTYTQASFKAPLAQAGTVQSPAMAHRRTSNPYAPNIQVPNPQAPVYNSTQTVGGHNNPQPQSIVNSNFQPPVNNSQTQHNYPPRSPYVISQPSSLAQYQTTLPAITGPIPSHSHTMPQPQGIQQVAVLAPQGAMPSMEMQPSAVLASHGSMPNMQSRNHFQVADQPGNSDQTLHYPPQVTQPGFQQAFSPVPVSRPLILMNQQRPSQYAAEAASAQRMATSQQQLQRAPTRNYAITRPPVPMRRIPENEYPIGQYDRTSVEIGLHLAGIRSPRRAPADRASTSQAGGRFYQYIKELAFEPVALQPRIGLRTFSFNVSGENASKLVSQNVTSADAKSTPGPISRYVDGSRRYRLRVCMQPVGITAINEREWAMLPTYWPEHIMIQFNGKALETRRKQHFHTDLPLELTDYIVVGENVVKISLPLVPLNIKAGFTFFVAVEVVETQSHTSIRKHVQDMGRIPAKETVCEVRRRLKPSGSDDIIIEGETLPVSLKDPFSAVIFDVPVRGVSCRHLECFDLETWLQTRPAKPAPVGSAREGAEPSMVDVWKCPICNLDARPNSLLVDEFFVHVRKTLVQRGEARVTKITMAADGTWKSVQVQETADDSDDEVAGPYQTASPTLDPARTDTILTAGRENRVFIQKPDISASTFPSRARRQYQNNGSSLWDPMLILSPRDTTHFGGPNHSPHDKAPLQHQTSTPAPPCGLTWGQASRVVAIFRKEYMPNFPFVFLDPGLSAEQLYAEKPFLFRAVMLAAAPLSEARIKKTKCDVLAYLGHRVLVEEKRTLDLLQGLLVCVAWAHMCHIDDEQVTNLAYLALGYANNLGITKIPAALIQQAQVGEAPEDAGQAATSHATGKTHSPDEQRALLGLFCILSINSTKFTRKIPLDTPYINLCCTSLAALRSAPTDLLLERLVRMVQMGEKLCAAFGEPHERGRARPYAFLLEASGVGFRNELDRIMQATTHPELEPYALQFGMYYNYIVMRLYEPATNVKLLEKEGIGPSVYRALCLRNCLNAARAYLDMLLATSATASLYHSIVTAEQTTFALLMAARLLLINTLDWDAAVARQTLDLPAILEQVLARAREVEAVRRRAVYEFAAEAGDVVTEEEMLVDGRLAEMVRRVGWLKEGFGARIKGEVDGRLENERFGGGEDGREEGVWFGGLLGSMPWDFNLVMA
ncbi:hypothetical protein G7046_g7349 [Stylonectria norvegica]|nr:hypothetical protein G7046_g7349 [Stylonectria norvegica]